MDKIKLILAIIYLISPIDIIPEALLGPFGLIDDGAALIYIIATISSLNEEKKVKKGNKYIDK